MSRHYSHNNRGRYRTQHYYGGCEDWYERQEGRKEGCEGGRHLLLRAAGVGVVVGLLEQPLELANLESRLQFRPIPAFSHNTRIIV